MKRLALSLVLLASACGGGGQSAFVQPASLNAFPAPSASPAASATAQPTISPTAAPNATASPVATATPVPASLKRLGGAPLTATASQLSTTRRVAQAQGVTNGLPVLVESSGMIASWAGDFSVWTTNVQTAQDIPQTGLTVTASGNLPINNPGPQPLSCLGQVSAMCAVHPTSWTWGTSSANGKPVGKQTLTVAFADGTTGTTNAYVYDGWSLPCNAGFAYVGGVPVAQVARAMSDVYADCVTGNIVFPKAGALFLTPAQDQYGRNETIFPTLTAAVSLITQAVNFPMASIAHGSVYAINTQDGGMAKVYFDGASAATVTSSSGMSLHANADLTYPF